MTHGDLFFKMMFGKENDMNQSVRKPFALNKREAKVIAMRFGLEGNVQHTLEEVGQQLVV